MSLVMAVEAWIMAILGWGVLTLQEMWAWSLLSAHVFYSILCLSTCNLILTGVFPGTDRKSPKIAYFTTVLCLFIHSAFCMFDTIQPLEISPTPFRAPSGSNCSLGKVHQVYFFTDSQFYLLQAGSSMGYLILQLIVAGAPVLDPEIRTLWPGSVVWGNCLACLLCIRFVIMFDVTARGVHETDRQLLYFMFFSEPIQALEVVFTIPLLFFLVIMGVQAFVVFRPGDRYFTPVVSVVNGSGMLVFVIMSITVMYTRSLLTLPLLVVILVPLIPAMYGFAMGIVSLLKPSSLLNVVPDPNMPAVVVPATTTQRQYIPVSIQMESDRKKGV